MAERSDFSPEEIKELLSDYRSGDMAPLARQDFERRFPHLIPAPTQPVAPVRRDIAETQRQLGAMREGFPFSAEDITSLIGPSEGPTIAPFTSLEGQLPSLAREAPNLSQVGAEFAGSLIGGMLGTPGGTFGRVAGTGIGTFGAGLATGRGLKDATIDAIESSVFDLATGFGSSRLRQKFIPSLPEAEQQALAAPSTFATSPRELILKGSTQTVAEEAGTGRAIQQGLASNVSAIKGKVDRMFDAVRRGVPDVDISDVLGQARDIGLTVPRVGAEIAGGVTSFDDAMRIRSLLLSQKRLLQSRAPGGGDKLKAAAVGEIEQLLEEKMGTAAKAAGMEARWRTANRFFKEQFADRFYQDFIHDIAESSAEKIVPQLERATLDEAHQFIRSMSQLNGEAVGSLSRARSGIVANILEDSTDKVTGLLRSDTLVNKLSNFNPEVLDTLLGNDVATALTDFAKTYAMSKRRISFTGFLGGTAGLAVAGAKAAVGGGGGVGRAVVAAIEPANELNFLGRMIVNRPTVAKAIERAILTGKDDAIRQLGLGGIMRMGTTQALLQSGKQFGVQAPDLSSLLGGT